MEEIKGMILIVDDEESIRNMVARDLELHGYVCETACDAKDALWKAFIKDFDLVLMDIKMPGISGLEVLPQMLTDHPDICIIMLTAVADTETAIEAMRLGAYDYITKPFDLDDLRLRVERALEKRRLMLENREYQRRLEQKVKQQVEQIQEYYKQAIEALSREEIADEEPGQMRASQRNKGTNAGADSKARDASGVREFARKLSRLFGGGENAESTASLDSAPGQKEGLAENTEGGARGNNKQGASPLDEQKAELVISPGITLEQFVRFYLRLKRISGLQAMGFRGVVDKEITISLCLRSPESLIDLLKRMPEVESVVEKPRENASDLASQEVGSSRSGEITVKLSVYPHQFAL
jgi:DNA-binding response OmpR family regulator